MKELRKYQLEAKDKLRKSIASGNKRIVLYSPTGSGKSVMAADLIQSFISKNLADLTKKGKRVAFIVNRIGLVNQFSEHLTNAGINHGVVQGQNTYGLDAQVLVCSINTVARRGMPPVDFCIIDESHGTAGSNIYKEAIFKFNNLVWIGLTATPFSKGMAKTYEELDNEPLWQDIVVAATIRELIELGFLVDCEIYAPSDPDLKGVRLQKNAFGELDYKEDDLGKAVDKPELIGDIFTHWKSIAGGKKTVVFATNVRHSQHIVDEFNRNGVRAEHIDGYMTQEQKEPILKRYASGETLVLSNVAMLREGWDVPSCEVMILAKPTRSLISWIQMCGRILRPFADKTHGIILDHSSTVHRLGYPTDDLPLKLCDGTKPESKSDKPEKKENKCPKCHFIKKKGRKCEKCGHETEAPKNDVEVEEGTLKKLERKGKEQVKSKDVLQAWYSQFLCYGKSKFYHSSWADIQFKKKFGISPNSINLNAGHSKPSEEVVKWVMHTQIAYFAMQKKLGK